MFSIGENGGVVYVCGKRGIFCVYIVMVIEGKRKFLFFVFFRFRGDLIKFIDARVFFLNY